MNLQQYHQTKFFCWLCTAFCFTDAELFEHCKHEHPGAKNWDNWIADNKKRIGKKMLMTKHPNSQMEHADREVVVLLAKIKCKRRMFPNIFVLLISESVKKMESFGDVQFAFTRRKTNTRDAHVCDRHSNSERIRLPNGKIRKEFNCGYCISMFEVQCLPIDHMIEWHGHESQPESKAESYELFEDQTSELSWSSEDEKDLIKKEQFDSKESDYELSPFISSMCSIKIEPDNEMAQEYETKEMELTSGKESKSGEEKESNNESTLNSSICVLDRDVPSSSFQSEDELISIQILTISMIQQPSIICYDYHMMN
ncbi:hypothetical protein M3Y98_00087700 [Aphelenchoides besseyi]|nr:hypothetical protein M3Y98_00087700 [Aphelenchoides besseyi]